MLEDILWICELIQGSETGKNPDSHQSTISKTHLGHVAVRILGDWGKDPKIRPEILTGDGGIKRTTFCLWESLGV